MRQSLLSYRFDIFWCRSWWLINAENIIDFWFELDWILRKLLKNHDLKSCDPCLADNLRTILTPRSIYLIPFDSKLVGVDEPLHLLHIFNLSLETAVFPKDWKHSVVRPWHKPGSQHDANKYWPIKDTPISLFLLVTAYQRSCSAQ